MDFTDSRTLYTALVGAAALMRLAELALSRRNISRLVDRGAIEAGRPLYPWMVAVHASFLASCVVEIWYFERPFIPPLAVAMIGVLALAAGLRWWAISSLGDRWSSRVFSVPGEPPVTSGPYRWLRHPNYLAVILEFLALPLVHTAWLTASFFSFANGILLTFRVRTEEAALAESSEYRDLMHDRPRFLPGRR